MGTFEIVKNMKGLKKSASDISGKGFKYFLKNVGLSLCFFGLFYLLGNPEILSNPSEFFANFDKSSWYTVGVMFAIVCLIYQLSKSLMRDGKGINEESIAKEVVAEQNKENEKKAEAHLDLIRKRMKNSVYIESLLKDIIIDLGATRACIFEMHNGTNSLAGCPFLFADANFEVVDKDTDYISDEFKNLSLTKYVFIMNHFDDGTWIGPSADIAKEDPRLANKWKLINDDYNAFMVLQGSSAPIGFLTVSFANGKHPGKAEIIAELNQKGQVISNLLDK